MNRYLLCQFISTVLTVFFFQLFVGHNNFCAEIEYDCFQAKLSEEHQIYKHNDAELGKNEIRFSDIED